MLLNCRTTTPAPDMVVAAEIAEVLERRGALKHPPVTIAISDAVALGIAGILKNPTPAGLVLGRFYRTGTIDSDELVQACRTEQGYASPEGHAALYCLIGWVQAQLYRHKVGVS